MMDKIIDNQDPYAELKKEKRLSGVSALRARGYQAYDANSPRNELMIFN